MTAAAGVAVALFATSQGAAAQATEPRQPAVTKIDRIHWQAPAGLATELRCIVVRNPHGDVRARRAEDGVIEVSGMRQPLAPGDAHVGLDVARRRDTLVISVGYPPGRRETHEPPQDGTDRLDLTVLVPDGVELDAESLRGIVEARRLHGPVRARSLDGDILAWAAGPIHAQSRGGRIEAHPGGKGAPTVLESETGQVIVVLVPSRGAEVWAETRGDIDSALEGALYRDEGMSRFHAVEGDGQPLVLARSATGGVTVRYEE